MAEVFQRGAHVIPIRIAQGNRGAEGKITIKQPVSLDVCSHRVSAWTNGDVFMVKPRGSPNMWKVYLVTGTGRFGENKMIAKFKDEDAAVAFARLTYG